MAENRALIPEPVTMYTQTDALKDVKDISKNFVSGDFERQYADRVVEKSRRRRILHIVTAVCLAAIVVGIVVVAVIKEHQISRLRHEIDDLKANMIATQANVKALNQKLANNRLFSDFKTLEDAIYADEDEGTNISGEKQTETLDKLQKLTTVLDDDEIVDDEDMYTDDEDEESGDWYRDYDNRRQKVGTTNMVHLKPEDFTDTVLTMDVGKHEGVSRMRQLKKLLNENPENPNIGLDSTFVSSTEAAEISREKRSVFPEASQEALDKISVPRIFTKDERRKTKKYMGSLEASTSATSTSPAKVSLHTVTRRSDDSGSNRRPFIAAHFHGNTSHLNPEIHEHYKGNGLLRVSHGNAHDVWYPSPWTITSPHPRPTLTRNGHIHVHHTGVYLVYVQIYYLDSHDIISWVLHRTNADIDGRETLLQCAQSSHSNERLDKPNSCFSASALFLKAGDRLAVRNTGGDRHSLMEPEKSFIGLIKLADAEDPNEEF